MRLPELSVALALLPVLVCGCSMSPTASPSAASGMALRGNVHGGQQAIVGAHVYLFAASRAGYGSASVSLLSAAATGHSDSIGAYVLSGQFGSFSITGDYTCTAGTQVYVYALGGDPGSGPNSAAGLLAAIGQCPVSGSFLSSTPFISVNEVTTVAAAWSLSGYAVDATHIAGSGSPLAATGMANAFATAGNLADISSGLALATTPAGNGTVPQTEVNTLANILSACINSPGPGSAGCTTLFANARSSGATGTPPADTATAAINIAHNPGATVTALFGLQPGIGSPFLPELATAPNDFTIAVSFPIGGGNLAVDGSGNIWITGQQTLFELSSTGVSLTPPGGFTGGGLDDGGFNVLSSIAIDQHGNAWVSNVFGGVAELSSTGTPLSPQAGYTAGGIDFPYSLAVDGFGTVWIANYGGSISKLSSSGGTLSPSQGYALPGNSSLIGIAIDNSESPWVVGQSGLNKLSNCGAPTSATVDCTPAPLSATTDCGHAISSATPYTGGGLNAPNAIAIDVLGDAWAPNSSGNLTANVSEFDRNGCTLSPSTGYTGATSPTAPAVDAIVIDGSGNAWMPTTSGVAELSSTGQLLTPTAGYISSTISNPSGLGIDGSGNVWVTNGTTTEFIGAATPVVTPLAAGVSTATLGTRP